MSFFNELIWFTKLNHLRKIKLVVFDVDGVLTDGKLYIDNLGNTTKSFNVKDGIAIKFLHKEGIKTAFLSGGSQGSTTFRAESLKVGYCLVGVKNKIKAMKEIQNKFGVNIENTAYLGDDLNDLPLINYVKLFVTPNDAVKELKIKSDAILNKQCGDGAAREFIERLLKAKGLWKNYASNGWLESN